MTALPTGRPSRPDPPCITHHAACRCREAAHEAEVERLRARVAELEALVADAMRAVEILADQTGVEPRYVTELRERVDRLTREES